MDKISKLRGIAIVCKKELMDAEGVSFSPATPRFPLRAG